MNLGFVVLMGIGTVFFGLICLIALSYIMSAICRSTEKKTESTPAAASAAPAAIPNRQAMIAAIAAVIAEEEGADVSGIRILSVKQL